MRKVYFLCLLLLVIVFACSQIQSTSNSMEELIAQVPVVSDSANVCNLEKEEAYKKGYSTWKDSTEIRYYIEYRGIYKDGKTVTDYFNNSDKKYIEDKTTNAANQWGFAIHKPIRQVSSIKEANMLIIFKFLEDDGIGGDLALAAFPPMKGELTKTSIRMDLADMYNYVKERDKAKHTYFTVILHEFGHAAAGLKHDNEYAVMNPSRVYKTLQIDDIVGARVNYKIYDNFRYQNVDYTFIRFADYKKQLTLNFKVSEFITRCSYPKYETGHFLSLNTINGIQFIRSYYGVSIKLSSSYRDPNCNHIAGGSTLSQHMFRNALDWRFIGKGAYAAQERYENDVINGNPKVLGALLSLGIRGFGSYPSNANHIDSRNVSVGNRIRFGQSYVVWGEFSKRGSFYDPISEFRNYD